MDMIAGTYTCDPCPEGYKDSSPDRSKPGRSCTSGKEEDGEKSLYEWHTVYSMVTEIDACSEQSKNDCHPYAICMPSSSEPSGFTCHCRDGFLDKSRDPSKRGRQCEESKCRVRSIL